MKKYTRRILIIASFLFIVALAYGIMKFLIAQKEPPPASRSYVASRYVRADIIQYDTILSPVSEPGRMTSVSIVDFAAEAPGKIEQGDIMLKQGAVFNKGDILFSIYSDEAALALKARKSEFLHSLAILLPDMAIDYPEEEPAFRSFFNSIEIDRSLPPFPGVKNEQLKIFLASRNVLSEYYSIRKDELQLSRYVVKAPFDGTLSEVYLEVGAYANTGGRVARAIQTDELELEVPLSMADAAWVKTGDPVEIHSDSRSYAWQGTVIRKSRMVDENTQSRRVYVQVKNHGKEPVLAGEFLTAIFPGRPVENVMEIPRNAVFNTNEVFIVRNRRLEKTIINIVKVNTNTLLFNGAVAGDTIVVQPLINVFEGTMVTTSLDQQGGEAAQRAGQE